jgi:hypothetical protein
VGTTGSPVVEWVLTSPVWTHTAITTTTTDRLAPVHHIRMPVHSGTYGALLLYLWVVWGALTRLQPVCFQVSRCLTARNHREQNTVQSERVWQRACGLTRTVVESVFVQVRRGGADVDCDFPGECRRHDDVSLSMAGTGGVCVHARQAGVEGGWRFNARTASRRSLSLITWVRGFTRGFRRPEFPKWRRPVTDSGVWNTARPWHSARPQRFGKPVFSPLSYEGNAVRLPSRARSDHLPDVDMWCKEQTLSADIHRVKTSLRRARYRCPARRKDAFALQDQVPWPGERSQ